MKKLYSQGSLFWSALQLQLGLVILVKMTPVNEPGALPQKDILHLWTYPMSAPPQVKEQIAPGSLLSSRTLAIILERKTITTK